MKKQHYALLCLIAASILSPPAVSSAIELPYYNTFDANTDFTNGGFTQENPGNTYTWGWSSKALRIRRANKTAHNDYLFCPAVAVEEGKCYHFYVDTKGHNTTTPGQFRLLVSEGTTSTSSMTEILPATETGGSAYSTFHAYYKATATGDRYFTIHCNTPAPASGYTWFYTDNIGIEEISSLTPVAPELQATASGTFNVDISVTAPGYTVFNEPLDELTDVVLLRNGVEVYRWESPEPGSNLSVTDNPSVIGNPTYSVIAHVGDAASAASSVTVSLGPDTSAMTPSVNSNYQNGIGGNYLVPAIYSPEGARLSWTAVDGGTDGDGEPIPVTYTITRLTDGQIVADDVRDCSFTDPDAITDERALFSYKVTASYGETTSDVGISPILSLNAKVPFVSGSDAKGAMEFTYCDIDKNSPDHWNWHVSSSTFTVYDRDDWLFSPGIVFEAGKHYKIEADMLSGNIIEKPVAFEIKAGATNTPEAMVNGIIGQTTIKHITPQPYYGFYSPETDGQLFIGIHAISPTEDNKSYDNLRMAQLRVTEVDGHLPSAVTDFNVKFSLTDPTKATLSFNAPATDISGANLEGLIRIDLYKDNSLFRTYDNPAPGETLTAEIDVQTGVQVNYKAVPYTTAGEGESAEIPVMLIEPPYSQNFDNDVSLAGYTIIDTDQSGFTWHLHNKQARCYPTSGVMDDWMVTPPMHLEGGKFYKIDFLAYNEATTAYPTAELSVKLGTEPTVNGLSTTIIPDYTVTGGPNGNEVLLKEYFTVSETGEYYVGFYAHSPGNTGAICIDNLNISAPISGDVPAPANDLTVTPDPNGGLNGQISFTAPTTTLGGSELTTISNVKVYRDGALVTTQYPSPGDRVSFETSVSEEGVHLYTVIASNPAGTGREAETVAYFGINRPAAPLWATAVETENYGEVTISWETSPTDYDGFPINPELITYEIARYTSEGEVQIATGLTGTSYTFRANEADAPQEFMRFVVRAWTTKGGSPGMLCRFISVGSPYTLPLTESFANYNPSMAMMQESVDGDGLAAWGFNEVDPLGNTSFDGDSGMALMEAIFAGGSSRLITGKISLIGATRPTLSLYVLNQDEGLIDENTLEIQIDTDASWVTLDKKSVDEWCSGVKGWQKITIDLSEYKDKVIYLGFVGEALSHQFTHIDRLSVAEPAADDLSLMSFTAPAKSYPGLEYAMTATIRNNGLNSASDYAVELYRDNELFQTLPGSTIAPGAITRYDFTDCVSINDAPTTHEYYTVINYAVEQDPIDNTSATVPVYVPSTVYPAVGNLSAVQTADGEVSLSWDAPVIPDQPTEITDDVENYAAWSTMNDIIGEWTLIDQDGLGVAGIQGIELPNVPINSKQSFFVMDSSYGGFASLEAAQSHSGNHHFAALAPYESGYAEDLLISPELTGAAQTLSLFAKSFSATRLEGFAVYTSPTFDTSDFQLLRSESGVPSDWTEYTFDLPEGTRYFAIRHYTLNGYMLFIDDITFTPAGNERLALNGYNVYRGTERINDVTVDTNGFTETGVPDGNISYGVTALYDLGESPESTVNIEISGLVGIGSSSDIAIYGLTGAIRIVNAVGLPVDIYAPNGELLYSDPGSNRNIIPMAPGIYIVKAGPAVAKVAVR